MKNNIRSLAMTLAAIGSIAGAFPASADEPLVHLLNGGAGVNPDAAEVTYPNRVAPGFKLVERANGFLPLENPSGIITHFGSLNDGTNAPIDSTKTEPDENT